MKKERICKFIKILIKNGINKNHLNNSKRTVV